MDIHRDLNIDALPTPTAAVARRLGVVGVGASADTFLVACYLAEAAIKLIAVGFYAGLREKAPDPAYRMAYDLVRADGLGTWDAWIRQASTQPLAGFLPPTYTELLTWAGKVRKPAEDLWFSEAASALAHIFGLLGFDSPVPPRRPTARDLVGGVVQLRNKTRAHGAVGLDFFDRANGPFVNLVTLFVVNCPVFHWRWVHLLERENGKNRGVLLRGYNPQHMKDSDVAGLSVRIPGVHVWPVSSIHPLPCGDLLDANRECTIFQLPNGGFSNGHSWFIDYATGNTVQRDVSQFMRPPVPLPPSETHGLTALDVQSNVFGNLPPLPPAYVSRIALEQELDRRLRDRNHPIITLHGRGGIGKTSLALKACHSLAAEVAPVFDHIVWLSARDIDLRPRGPAEVRPAVVNLDSVSRIYGQLFESENTPEAFALALATPGSSGAGTLFVFDNFETMEGMRELHEFLDTHTHLPNKVLITSRERAFKADFPIEVQGMDRDESFALMTYAARDLGVEPLLGEDVKASIFEYSEGHPYVMRVLVGELAKERRYVPAKSMLPRRLDIVNAVFERSFNKLSLDGRHVFLTVACWRSLVSELALLVVLGQRGLDVEAGLEECLRLSLLEARPFLDDQPAYTVPQVARLFARKKLEGDPDRLVIEQDLVILQKFGVVSTAQAVQVPQREVVQRFIDSALSSVSTASVGELDHVDGIMESLAELWPDAWLPLAHFRRARGASTELIDYALRRAVEEVPSNKEAMLERAEVARGAGDENTFISNRLLAVETDPADRFLLREVAFDVCKYINDHSADIPVARRSIYLATLRDHMSRLAPELDATGLSRLAWLYLLENDKAKAWRYASLGLQKDGDNKHCYNIIQKLRTEGFVEDAQSA
jgi:hypothetical protein